MQIREGAYYRTRHGDVVGPMRRTKDQSWYSCYHTWNEDGGIFLSGAEHGLDLINEVYVSDTPPSEDVMLNLSEIARAKTKAMGEGNFGLDENSPCGIRLRWLVEVVDRPHDTLLNVPTPPADAPAPEAKTLRDKLEEKAALAILSGYYANPTLGPSENTLGDIWDMAKEFVEARKK
jgi:hypothetical protein